MANTTYDSGATYDSGLRYASGPEVEVPQPKKRMAKPKLELKKRSDSELSDFAASIVGAMTGNPNFTTPTPALASVTTALTAFNTATADFVAATNAARLATVEKDNARLAVEALLTQLAGYVEAASAGDEAKILTAGMAVRSTAAPVGLLPAPINVLAVSTDTEGKIDLTWLAVAGASGYEVECRLHVDAAAWTKVKTVTASKLSVPDLTPGALYAFRVRAVGAAGAGPWSDETVRRAP